MNIEPDASIPLASGFRRVTLGDIARRAGVSKAAVSLALRNHPSISLKRREEIRRLAEAMGYHPDPSLASLVAYRDGGRPVKIQTAATAATVADDFNATRTGR